MLPHSSLSSLLRESSKAVVNSLLATKDLDLHLLTSRIAGMSCPTDGMDLSSYKNSIEDIRQILEARHAGHYAVFNLCEKKYAAARFPNGRVVDVGWTANIAPSLEELLDVAMRALEFLGSNRQNVIAVHCLDGRSNTALLFASMLMVCKVFSGHEDCLNLFELKRCEPVLTGGQRAVLKQLERVLKHGPSVQVRKFILYAMHLVTSCKGQSGFETSVFQRFIENLTSCVPKLSQNFCYMIKHVWREVFSIVEMC